MSDTREVPNLPDAQRLELAAQSMFGVFAGTPMGPLLADRQPRIAGISGSCRLALHNAAPSAHDAADIHTTGD